MVDRETETIWTHLDGEAIAGPLNGQRLVMVPLPQMTWGDWKLSRPDTLVLSPDTPFADRYRPVQIARYNRREDQYGDDRLAANALVVGVEINHEFKAYPVAELVKSGGLVNDTLDHQPVLIFYDSDSRTGLAYSSTQSTQFW